jgi:hypothetical protein
VVHRRCVQEEAETCLVHRVGRLGLEPAAVETCQGQGAGELQICDIE